MNQISLRHAVSLSIVCLAIFTTRPANAQTAQDDAAKNVYTNGWFSGTNGGTGFGPWTLLNNNNPAASDYSGFLINSAGSIDVSNKSFTLYANGNNYDYAAAYRALSNSLSPTNVLILKFRNNYISANGIVGFALRNGKDFTQTNDFATLTASASTRFSFYFVGGGSFYHLYDGGGDFISDVPYTSDGLTLEFSLMPGDQYRLAVKSGDGNTIIHTYEGPGFTLNGLGGGTIDSLALFAMDVDYNGSPGDVSFNQLKVVAATSLPPVIQDVTPASGSFYLPTSTQIVFTASTAFSAINTNNIKVTANGVNVSSLAFSGSSTNWLVTASPALLPNVIYTNVITVTDNNGNTATNFLTFNTWSATNIYVEAEDYNYGGGNTVLTVSSAGQFDSVVNFSAISNVDFFELNDGGTNPYRTNDAVDLEISADAADHFGYAAATTTTNWSLDYVQSGEWLNYTRTIKTNTAYNVYARVSGGPVPKILVERHVNVFANNTNQPRVAIGNFVGSDTGNIVYNYAFAPLKDFFGNTVALRFTVTNNTFRLTRVGDAYNMDYFTFVPVTSASTLRPYIADGFPSPNAVGVLPDQKITLTIANRQTSVATNSIQLIVNGANVAGGAGFSMTSNTIGTVIAYTPSALYPLNTSNTVRAVFTDSAAVTQTNDWIFYTADILVIPPSYALASGSGVTNGFNMKLVKFPDVWPATAFPAPLSSTWAETMLAGGITNASGASVAPSISVNYTETNTINYELCGRAASPDGFTFSNSVAFPNVPLGGYAPCSTTNGPNNFALSAQMYVQLNAGLYQWAVRSDDGFRLTTGTNAANPTSFKIMDYEGGRGAQTPSVFSFIIQTNGVYPMRMLYYQGGYGASVQLYGIDRATGANILINDPSNPSSVKVYLASTAPAAGVVLLNPARSGSNATFNFVTQAGKTHTIQYRTNFTTSTWQTLKIVAGNGSNTNIVDSAATNATRFYRVSTQ